MARKNYKRLLQGTFIVSALLTAQSVRGQALEQDTVPRATRLDDIVVTARKVPERALDVPLAVTVITAEAIEAADSRSALDLISYTPNAAVSGGIAGTLQGQLSIRGISTLVRNIGLESGSSLFVDGVYVGRPENLALELLDVEQVEIIRGPQGTEFGKNTIAGVINIRTREPTDDPYLRWRAGIGNYGEVFGQATLNAGLGENLSASVSGRYTSRDGFYRHLSDGKDAENANLFSWRGAVKFEPTDDAKFLFRADGLRDRSVPGFFQARALMGFPAEFPSNKPHRINNNRPNRLERDGFGLSLTASFKISDVNVTSITAYRQSSFDALLDDDQEQVDFVSADAWGDESDIFSQELRVDGDIGQLKYLFGVYYFDQDVTTARTLALGATLGIPGNPPINTDGSVRTRSQAAFGRLDYKPFDRLTLSAGLRYTRETKRAAFVQADPTGIFTFLGFPNLQYRAKAKKDDLSPTASVSFALSENANVYLRYAKGFKSGAYNVDLASSVNGLAAGPENASSFEAGVKAEVARHLWVNLAAFHVDYDNLQVSQVLGGGISLSNAGKARAQGLEAELTLAATDSLRIMASSGLLDAEYRRFRNCGVPASTGGGIADCSGNRLALAPTFTAHAAVEFSQPIGGDTLFLRADVDRRSAVYFEPTNSVLFRGRARTLVDFHASYRHQSWEVIGWVKNLGDKVYETYMDDRSAIGVLRTAAYGAPRTYGVTIAGRF